MIREIGVQFQVNSYQKLKKMVLDTSFFNTQHYNVQIKSKCCNAGKGVTPFPTP